MLIGEVAGRQRVSKEQYLIAPSAALAAIPEELPAEEAGPFMCAGVTVYNALRIAARAATTPARP